MPEGDTIYRAAATLNRALAGHQVVRFESVFPALTRVHEDHPLTRMTVDKVASAGKHVLMYFSGGYVLRTHMRMSGSWHIYRTGERWQRGPRDMRILVATAGYEAVGFKIPDAEFIEASALAKHDVLRKLGPDVLDEGFDRGEAVRRLRSRPSMTIGDAVLTQQVMAGLGNVFKSEVLFACGIHPFARVADLDQRQIDAVVETGRTLARANVVGDRTGLGAADGSRRTTGRDNPAERLWVYGRARLPCRRCGTAIEVRKHGADARLTYWCPTCQTL